MEQYVQKLIAEGVDPQKIDAITSTEGPLLVIAGPGSGKTKTLVERIVYLIHKGVAAEDIMVATFTEKAAKELITRISNRLLELNLKVNLNEMYIGTLHSIFLRFLEEFREYTRLKRNYRLLDDFDQKYFLFRNLHHYLKIDGAEELLGDHTTSRWEKAKKLIAYVGKVSEECLDITKLCAADDERVRAIGEFYKVYISQLAQENALDFSTIQSEALYVLENHPHVLKKLQEKIRYIMIDEYQDTNTIQEKIILLLASSHQNLCVVGDDDQGLYRFRGATIRNILEFPKNFKPGACKEVKLVTNYRSHPDIIQFYNNWMKECDWKEGAQSFRFEKNIQPRDGDFTANPSVLKLSSEGSWEDYYAEVYQFIQHLEESGTLKNRNQMAFLFKSVKNDKVIGLAHYLEQQGIQVFSPRSALFFEREEVQLLLGAIIFVFPLLEEQLKWKDDAHLEVWNTYTQWKTKFASAVRSDLKKHEGLIKWCQRRAKEHLTLSGKTKYAFASLLYQLLEFPMFADYLSVDLKGNKADLRAAYNIALLSQLLSKFEYLYNISVLTVNDLPEILRNLFNQYLRFIIEGGIEEYEDFDEYAPSDCVSFMTIHQSKGLEFPIVITGSLNLVPVKQYDEVDVILQKDFYTKPPFEPIEKVKFYDFWRLFYTAFSRPQNLLVLSCREKEGQGRSPSKYFEKVFRPLPHWRNSAFEATQLHLEDIKPVNIKHEYSFTSHILLYENCPLQYKFYKELEFTEVRTGGALGGSLLHQTIEDIHKAVLKGEEHTLTDENIKDWYNNNYHLLSKQQRAYLQQAQIEALFKQVLRYRDRNEGQWHRIKEAEVDVSLVKEQYILKGTIDLIKGENETVELVDFKSGDKPDVNTNDAKDKKALQFFKRQLEVYAHIIEERYGLNVSKMHLYFPKEETGSPYITFPYNKTSIENTIQAFDKTVSKIENKDFDMTHVAKSEKQCGNCDMRYHCNPAQFV